MLTWLPARGWEVDLVGGKDVGLRVRRTVRPGNEEVALGECFLGGSGDGPDSLLAEGVTSGALWTFAVGGKPLH